MSESEILLPAPRSVIRKAGCCSRPDLVTEELNPEVKSHPEGYRLEITSNGVRITAQGPAGAFYAKKTLGQLLRGAQDAPLPCLRVEDWPDFPTRGVMLDISRNKVPTMGHLYALIDRLAEWKINQFQLYMEHTFAYRNHEKVWRDASPVTAEEIRALDRYCRDRFIELVPNQNSFGHMKPWLIHPEYRHLAEAPDGCDTVWGPQEGPFSLYPREPGAIELLRELYDELLPNFTSRLFNVGCDETVDLGRGRSREVCEQRGKGPVYLDFLLQIHGLVCERERTMMFWGDILNQHPELIPEVPRDCIALEWGYEADHPFDDHARCFAETGIPFYVCPGTSSWCSFLGRTDNALANLKNAARAGLKHGASGYLVTDWGDQGHWQPWPVSWLGFMTGAALGWCVESNEPLDVRRALDTHVFDDPAGVMGSVMTDLGNLYKIPDIVPHNASSMFNLFRYPDRPVGGEEGPLAGLTMDALEKVQAELKPIRERLTGARMACEDASLIIEELDYAMDLMDIACRMGQVRLQGEAPGTKLRDKLRMIAERFAALWPQRFRPGGLPISLDAFARVTRLSDVC